MLFPVQASGGRRKPIKHLLIHGGIPCDNEKKHTFPGELRQLSGRSAKFAVQIINVMLFSSPAVPNDLIYEGITTPKAGVYVAPYPCTE